MKNDAVVLHFKATQKIFFYKTMYSSKTRWNKKYIITKTKCQFDITPYDTFDIGIGGTGFNM